jgi:glycosyltransferase involved in cell wall biosynthesis
LALSITPSASNDLDDASRQPALTPPPIKSSRLRVLIMPEWYPWTDQPVNGTFCREQARAVSRIHDVVVITWRAEKHRVGLFSIDQSIEDGILTYRIRFARSSIPKLGFLTKMLGILTVVGRLRRNKAWIPDIVHAHEYVAGLPANIVAAMSRAPVVMTEHSSAVALGHLDSRHRAAARRAFKCADVVCPVSEDLGRRLVGLAGRTPVVPVPNAVNGELFCPRSIALRGSSSPQSEVKLLTVGNLVTIKGHRYLIQALAQLRASGVAATLDVVGDGPLRSELQAQANSLGVGANVKFHGILSQERIAALMDQIDIFVLPSMWETLGCALIEAMASGRPSVATNVGGVPEVLDRRAGVLVEPKSPEALAAGIVEVLDHLDDYQPQWLHDLAVDRYGRAAISDEWSAVYRSALSIGRPDIYRFCRS